MKRVMSVVVMLVAAAMLGGCVIEDMVKAPVPKAVQKELGVPAEVPLSQMPEIREQYAQVVADRAAAAAAEKAEAIRQINVKARGVASGYAARIAALVAEQNTQLEALGEDATREAAKAEQLAAAATNDAKRQDAALAAEQQRAQERVDSIRELGNGILGWVAPQLANAVPGLGIGVSGLLAAGAWLLKRPGEDARVAAEKEDSYSKGRRDALAMLAGGQGANGQMANGQMANGQMANGQIVK
jgi:hypothetical protein